MLNNSKICGFSNKKDHKERRNNIRIPLQDDRKDKANIRKSRYNFRTTSRFEVIKNLHLSVEHSAGALKNNSTENGRYDPSM